MAMNRETKRMLQRQGAARRPTARPRGARRSAATRARPGQGERTAPGQFLREVRGELRKVAWPTRAEVIRYSIIVLIAVVVLTAFIFVLDYVFARRPRLRHLYDRLSARARPSDSDDDDRHRRDSRPTSRRAVERPTPADDLRRRAWPTRPPTTLADAGPTTAPTPSAGPTDADADRGAAPTPRSLDRGRAPRGGGAARSPRAPTTGPAAGTWSTPSRATRRRSSQNLETRIRP